MSTHANEHSPFHAGELAVQARSGVLDRAALLGKMFRPYLTEQHRVFFAQLPLLFVGYLDDAGQPWASALFGAPGFVSAPDPLTLSVEARPAAADPLHAALWPGARVGVLGIELPTRRRNRMNGRVRALTAQGFTLEVDQSFGNCPKFISARSPEPTPRITASPPRPEGPRLSAAAAALITCADTCFIASASGHESPSAEGATFASAGARESSSAQGATLVSAGAVESSSAQGATFDSAGAVESSSAQGATFDSAGAVESSSAQGATFGSGGARESPGAQGASFGSGGAGESHCAALLECVSESGEARQSLSHDPREGADVSHRGGKPGFVRVQRTGEATTLLMPDFPGNNAFNTLGNIARYPRAGLLVPDFATGDMLSLTCSAEILWDGPELARFQGAERMLVLTVQSGWYFREHMPYRWSEAEPGPQVERTGSW